MNFDQFPPNPRKTDSVRRLGTVDIAELRKAVLDLPESVWQAENAGKKNRFETLGATQHIIFRMVDSFADWRKSFEGPLWPDWKPLLDPVLTAATADYGYARGAFPRVMLARMAPAGFIQPHRDTNPAAKWPHKIHVPLVTNPKVAFLVHETVHHFVEGEAVEVNNMGAHAVRNGGTTPRIHLIFEYYDLDQPEPHWMDPLCRELERQAS
ncbi:MAG: aspartyl/asparaginyl beta-hydroxylase domain-containing protein [Sphingomicrobium sp.]